MKGFSLVELLTSMAILAVLVVISLPQYKKYLESGGKTAVYRYLKDIATATLACAANSPFDKCDTLGELGIQLRINARVSAGSKVCYRIFQTIAGSSRVHCVSIDAGEGTYKIVQAGRYCHTIGPDPLDPNQNISLQPSPPLMCRRYGTMSPDCPAAFPRCYPIGGGNCSSAAICQ